MPSLSDLSQSSPSGADSSGILGILGIPDINIPDAPSPDKQESQSTSLKNPTALLSRAVDYIPGYKTVRKSLQGVGRMGVKEYQQTKSQRPSEQETAGGAMQLAATALPGTGYGSIGLQGLLFGSGSAMENGADLRTAEGSKKIAGQAGLGILTSVLTKFAIDKLAGAVSERLQTSAEKQYSQALGATGKADKFRSDRVVPGLLKNRVTAFTQQGLADAASSGVERSAEKLAEEINKLPPNAKVNINPMLQSIEKAKNKLIVSGSGEVSNPILFKKLSDTQSALFRLSPDAENISAASARSYRQLLDNYIAENGGFIGKQLRASSIKSKDVAANAIRKELASEFPNVAKVNAEFNFYKNFQTVVQNTISRTKSQTGLTEPLAAVAGLASGNSPAESAGRAAFFKYLVKSVRSTAWRTFSAVNKARLAEFLVSENLPAATALLNKLEQTTLTKVEQ